MDSKLLITSFFILNSFFCFSQKDKFNSKLIPYKIGAYFGFGNEQNFIFDDLDYFYNTHYIKISLHYPLNDNTFQLELNLQPQIHFIKHQLLNKYFVLQTDDNYEDKRVSFTKLKSMRLYELQFELMAKRKVSKKIDAFAFLSFGPATVDRETERLKEGFTFIENLGLGLSYRLNENTIVEIKPSFNHISNAQIRLPNSGYNVLNLEIGLSIKL